MLNVRLLPGHKGDLATLANPVGGACQKMLGSDAPAFTEGVPRAANLAILSVWSRSQKGTFCQRHAQAPWPSASQIFLTRANFKFASSMKFTSGRRVFASQ